MVLIQTFEQGETLKKKDLFHHEVLFVNVDVIMEVARKKNELCNFTELLESIAQCELLKYQFEP